MGKGGEVAAEKLGSLRWLLLPHPLRPIPCFSSPHTRSPFPRLRQQGLPTLWLPVAVASGKH